MPKPPEDYLADIVAAGHTILRLVEGFTIEEFQQDERTYLAVERVLSNLGEAAYQLPASFKASYPSVPWEAIVRTRHRLVHGYHDIRVEYVWEMATRDVPTLLAQLDRRFVISPRPKVRRMPTYLEHANITVPDLDAAITFLTTAFPEFQVRHDSGPKDGHEIRWVHIGTPASYIALQEPHKEQAPRDLRNPYNDIGINHLGWITDDFDGVIARLEAAGYRPGMPTVPHPQRKRAYYYDHAGFEWEIIQYLSEDLALRNDYAL